MPKASSFVLATDREVQNAKPKGARAEFRIKGAQNLVLRVSATGTKTWAFLYSRPTNGRRCKLSLGAYPAIGLTKAKQEAMALTVAVLGGKDPLHQRREERAADTSRSSPCDILRNTSEECPGCQEKPRNDRSRACAQG